MTMLDVHVTSPVIGLSDREMAIVRDALRFHRVEFTAQRDFCDRMNCLAEREEWRRRITELDIVRMKLGDVTKEEEREK